MVVVAGSPKEEEMPLPSAEKGEFGHKPPSPSLQKRAEEVVMAYVLKKRRSALLVLREKAV